MRGEWIFKEIGQDLLDLCQWGNPASKQMVIFSEVSPLPRMTQGKGLQGLIFGGKKGIPRAVMSTQRTIIMRMSMCREEIKKKVCFCFLLFVFAIRYPSVVERALETGVLS